MPQLLSEDEFNNQFGGGFRATPERAGKSGLFGAAMDDTAALALGVGEAAGLPVGGLRRGMQAQADATRGRYYQETGAPRSFSETNGAGDVVEWGTNMAIGSIPAMAAIAGGGLVGGVPGALAAGSAYGIGDVLASQRDQAGETNLATAVPLGVAYGAVDSMLGVGGMLARRSVGTGIRALDTAGVNLLDGLSGMKGVAARTGATALKTAGVESIGETSQEGLNQLGRMSVDPDETFYNERSAENFKESAIGGGLLGGLLGGAAGGWRRSQGYAAPLDETQERNLLTGMVGPSPELNGPVPQQNWLPSDMEGPAPELRGPREVPNWLPAMDGPAPEQVGPPAFEQQTSPIIVDPNGIAATGPNALETLGEDPGLVMARERAVAQQQQAQELQAEAQRQQAEKARIESFGVTAKGDNHKLYQELEALRDEGTITPAQFTENAAKIVGETPVDRNGARKFVRDVVKAQQPKPETTRPAYAPTAAEVAQQADTDNAPKVAAVTPDGKRTFQVKPAAPVAPVAPKEDFRTRYRAANTEISALRAERKKLVVPKDATGNAIKGAEAELGDFGDVDATSPQGKRIAEIDNRIRAVLPPVADIRAQVENVLSMRDQTSDGKSRPRDPVLQRRLSAVTGIVMGENGLEQPATPLTMTEVARQEGVSKQAISQQLQKHGLSDLHISRLVANELEAPADTVADTQDENDATSDSASDQVTEQSIDDTSMRVSSSAARATGDGIVGVGGADMTPEQKQAEAAATRLVKSLGKEAEAAPTEQDLAFEAKRKEVAKAALMREMAAWVQTGNGRLLGQWWNDRALMANHPMFEDLPADAQVNWAQATFKLTSEENTDAQFDAIYAEQSKGLPTAEPEVRDASGPSDASGDGAPVEAGGGRRDAPAPVVVTKKPRVVRDAQGRKINADVLGPGAAEAAAVNRDVTGPGIPNVAINADAAQFSKTLKADGSTAADVEAELKAFMRVGGLGNKVTVVQSVSDLPPGVQRSVNPTDDTQGFVVGGKAYLVAGNIAKGKAKAVFLHEVGAHLGLENLLGAANYAALVSKVKQWAAKADGSQESKLAQAAQQRVADAGTDATQADSELVAYFIEEAVNAGVDPTATKADTEFGRWFRALWAAFKTAMHALGVNPDKLTAQDVVDMAYGAAKLEATGTFHGTAGEFRKFDHKYMGSGEGAQAFGWGSYFAQAPGIAKGYWKTDVANKNKHASRTQIEGDIARHQEMIADAEERIKSEETYGYYRTSDGARAQRFESRENVRREREKIEAHKDMIREFTKMRDALTEGNLMRVDFNVADDEWLDLDKPLSEQSEKVKAALLAARNAVGDDYSNKLARTLVYATEGTDRLNGDQGGRKLYLSFQKTLGSDKAASEYLDSIGIKGNKFLDANSRNAINASASFKVRKDGSGFEVQFYDAKGNETWTASVGTNPEAFAFGREEVAKAAKAPTSNFVVFNDKNIQRVSSMKAADRNRVSFSKAAKSAPLNDTAANFLELVKLKGSDYLVKFMLTKDLIGMASKVIPSAKKYLAAMDAVTVEKTKAERSVADIVESFSKLSKTAQGTGLMSVNKMLKDSTMAKAWAFEPDWLPKGSVKVDPVLAKRFNDPEFSKEARELVKRVFQHGHDSLTMLQKAVVDNTNSEYDAIIQELTKAGKLDEAKVETAKKAKSLSDFESLMAIRSGWPYAPLRRFGKHVVMAMSARYKQAKKDGNVKLMQELEKDGDHYYVAFAEGRMEAQRMVRDLKDSYPDGDVGTFEKLEQADAMMGGRDMLGAMRRLRRMAKESVEDKDLGEKTADRVDDMMRQLYLTLLSETSARKGEIHRKNIAGANEDMMRAFSTQGVATAHFIASLKTNGKIEDHLADMRTEVGATLSDRDEKQRYFNEIMRRHSMNLEFNPTPGIDKALSVSSVYLLLSNPSYFLMNATQPWMMSHPMMAGKFGYARSATALVQGYKDVMPILKDVQFDEKSYGKLPADVRDALEALANKGVIQIELGQELGQFQSSPDDRLRHVALALGKLRGAAQGVETLNRLSTAIAAYRLEKQRTGSGEAAIDYAAQVINETHGDYTGFNAPRFMRTGLGRLTTQFRKFQLIQLSMFARLISRSFKGASPEERTAARYALGYNLAHLGAIGGVAALPGFTAAAWLVGKAFGDDEPDDPRAALTRAVGKDMADLLWGGATQAAGVPLGGRIGAGNMLSVLPYTDIEVSREGYSGILMGLTGPLIGGLLPRAYDGIGMVASGDLWKGAEALAPSGVANISKAVRFQVEGVTQRNGDQAMSPEDISYLDSALQAVGLPPNTLQERTYLAGAKFKADTFYKDRTSSLKKAYSEAFRDNDADAMREVREEWQSTQVTRRELGFAVQPLSELLKAPQEQRKREAGMVGGVGSNKSTEGFLRAMSE